eukprot:11182762-Lingulodinium_polyedra.AAC.1
MECASVRFASPVRPHCCAAFCTAMRSTRPSVAAAARELCARALHARASFLVRAWSARACDLRAGAATDARFERIVVQ